MLIDNIGYIKTGPGIDLEYMPAFIRAFGHILEDRITPYKEYYIRIGSPISVYQGTLASKLFHQFDTKTTREVSFRPFPNADNNTHIGWYINKGKTLIYICVQISESSTEEIGFVTNVSNITYRSR